MNLNNINEGQIFKNYKELCEEIGEPVKSGKSKKLQLDDWNRYFEFSKSGHNFIINKIHDIPIEKTDLRVNGNNKVKYIDKIENLILDLLVQKGNNGQIFLSKNRLLHALQMVNDNYTFGKSKPFRLSKLMNITKEEIDDFFETSDGLLKRNLEAALDSLRNQALITWKHSLTVCYVELNLTKNDYDNVKVVKTESVDENGDIDVTFNSQTQPLTVHRKATLEEEQLILRTERDVLMLFECRNVAEVYKINKIESFYKIVREILFQEANIYLYYNSYEIISNKDQIIEEYESPERIKIQNELNECIVDKLKHNTAFRYNRAFERFEETQNNKYKIRMDEMYVENNYKLTDVLIKKGAESIKVN